MRGSASTGECFKLSPDLRGVKVLVVDDNATSRDIFQEMLESFSFEVTLAASGQEGLTELEKASESQPFELVIMDWKMPGMGGIEVSKRIKNHTGLSKIPAIVMVTAYGREEVMQQVEEVGLEGFLLKPVNPSMLFDATMQAFGKAVPEIARVAQRKEQDAEAFKHIQGARLLLVEDKEINQQVAKEILEGAGLNVTLANDGQEAINAVKESNYDPVLMDVQMPVMDGYTATREIRNLNSEIRNVPIIAMTAHAMAGDEAVMDLQAAAVNLEKLVKGVDKKTPSTKELNLKFSELENALNQALESAQSLGVSAEENVGKLSAEDLVDIPTELSQDIAKRIRDASEMGDVTTLNAIAEEIKGQSDSCTLLSKQIIQMAEDFDLDGI